MLAHSLIGKLYSFITLLSFNSDFFSIVLMSIVSSGSTGLNNIPVVEMKFISITPFLAAHVLLYPSKPLELDLAVPSPPLKHFVCLCIAMSSQ